MELQTGYAKNQEKGLAWLGYIIENPDDRFRNR